MMTYSQENSQELLTDPHAATVGVGRACHRQCVVN